MTSNPTAIVEQTNQVDEQFQRLMGYVSGQGAETSTIFEVEQNLVKGVLKMGRELLQLFLAHQAQLDVGEVLDSQGQPMRNHGWRDRRYRSVFGPVVVRRRYYRSEAGESCYPLDAQLSLPERGYSDLLTSWLEHGVTGQAYDQAADLLSRILGVSVVKHALERLTAEDAADVDAFYEQAPAPPAEEEGSILVAQVDGKGVRMAKQTASGERYTEKKESVVTALYSIDPYQRSASAIADKLAGLPIDKDRAGEPTTRPKPVAKRVRATLDGKDIAFQRLRRAIELRRGPWFEFLIILTDGDKALQRRAQRYLPDFLQILDIVHATDYIADTAEALLGKTHSRLRHYVNCRLDELLAGEHEKVTSLFETMLFQRTDLSKEARSTVVTSIGYLRRNAERMQYDLYLQRGWPIGTGIVEGACGHLVKDRMEQAGMKWVQTGAQAVLHLRAVLVNGDRDDHLRHRRRQQAHARLYASSAVPALPAEQLLTSLAS